MSFCEQKCCACALCYASASHLLMHGALPESYVSSKWGSKHTKGQKQMLLFNQTAQNTVRIFEEFLFLQSNKYANSVYKMKVDKKKKIYKYRIFVEKNSRGPGMSIGHWDLICNVGSHWVFFFRFFFLPTILIFLVRHVHGKSCL